MNLAPAALEELYSKFGFQVLPTGVADVRAFALRTGYFLNADIVPLTTDASPEIVKAHLDAAGYACSVRHFETIEDADAQLFAGFFAAESSRDRLMQEYTRFSKKVARALGAPYEYIAGPFSAAEHGKDLHGSDIIRYLLQLLSSEGPTLVT